MANGEPVSCVLIVRKDGSKIWTPALEYARNPEPGSYVWNDRKAAPKR